MATYKAKARRPPVQANLRAIHTKTAIWRGLQVSVKNISTTNNKNNRGLTLLFLCG
jgi:hypothetical protein